MFRRQLCHLARAKDQTGASAETPERSSGKFYRSIADRYGAIGDARLRPHALARCNGTVKEEIEHRARRPRLARNRIGFLHL